MAVTLNSLDASKHRWAPLPHFLGISKPHFSFEEFDVFISSRFREWQKVEWAFEEPLRWAPLSKRLVSLALFVRDLFFFIPVSLLKCHPSLVCYIYIYKYIYILSRNFSCLCFGFSNANFIIFSRRFVGVCHTHCAPVSYTAWKKRFSMAPGLEIAKLAQSVMTPDRPDTMHTRLAFSSLC